MSIVGYIRIRKPSIKLAIALLEPEKSGKSLHELSLGKILRITIIIQP